MNLLETYRAWMDAKDLTDLACSARRALVDGAIVSDDDLRDGTESREVLEARVKVAEAAEAKAKRALLAALDGRVVPEDVTGQAAVVRDLRGLLGKGLRDLTTVNDLAEPVAAVFRAEGWEVVVEPGHFPSVYSSVRFIRFTPPAAPTIKETAR